MNDVLININPKTDFEKLLFAQHEIKELIKINKSLYYEIGVLKSEMQELVDSNKVNKAYTAHKIKIRDLELKNKKLKKDLSELINKRICEYR